ncbi:hypothetical protein BHM03_00005351 [Ensete ventricosum]|nr:hypothetical protein BHM03_00005351 [Ensete ventricosum]
MANTSITRPSQFPVSFSAIPNNLSASLGLLLANSLALSYQTPDTLGELPTHSWRVPNRICSQEVPRGAPERATGLHHRGAVGLGDVPPKRGVLAALLGRFADMASIVALAEGYEE